MFEFNQPADSQCKRFQGRAKVKSRGTFQSCFRWEVCKSLVSLATLLTCRILFLIRVWREVGGEGGRKEGTISKKTQLTNAHVNEGQRERGGGGGGGERTMWLWFEVKYTGLIKGISTKGT